MTDYLHYTTDLSNLALASAFDEVSLWSSRFGAFLINHLELRPHLHILDLACGTGFPLFELARIYGNTCQLTGVDSWKEAVTRARTKQNILQLSNVTLVEADAVRLPFDANHFDLLVSNLGINNFADVQAVLRECFRVAKPGTSLVLTTNPNGHMQEFYDMFREVLQDLQVPEYLERLHKNEMHRGDRISLSLLLEDAGFHIVKVRENHFHMRYLDGTALFNHWLTKIGFLDGWKAVVNPEDEEHIFGLLEAKLNAKAQAEGELRLTIPMLYLEGKKS